MKYRGVLAIVAVMAMMAIAITAEAKQANDSITSEWVRSHYNKREVMVTMRDGARLFTAIYEPKDNTVAHPIIMNRTCYGSTPYGEDLFMPLERAAWREFTRNSYIFVFQDVRGKNRSEGVFEDLRPFVEGKKRPRYNKRGEVVVDAKSRKAQIPIDEASDTYDTAEWLIHNTRSNGNIGVFGISYPGFYSTMAALSDHPAIKAVSPQAPVTDWFRGDDAHHNGAFFIADMFSFQHWFEYVNTPAFHSGDYDALPKNKPTDTLRSDIYTDYLRIGAVRNFTQLMGDSVRGWSDMISHPDLDDWWEARNVLHHCKNIKPAVMIVGGLFDAEDCYGAFATYKQIRRTSPQTELYLVEGPWAHGMWGRGAKPFFGNVFFGEEQASDYYLTQIEYPFFAYYLEGKGARPSAKARVFDSGSAQWRYLPDGWPLESPKQAYYLAESKLVKDVKALNSLSNSNDSNASNGLQPASVSTLKPFTYISDPSRPVPFVMQPGSSRTTTYMLDDQRFASTRPDVAVFQTEVLGDTLQLLGDIEAELEVAISTTDADFVVKVIDVFPDGFSYPAELYRQHGQQPYLMSGYQMLVRGEVMRGKYRNSFSRPEPFTPGQRTKVKFSLPDVAHTFLPGHRLMVQVQSSWFPLVDRNPQTFCNIYTCPDNAFQTSTITIFPESKLWLPVR